MRDQDTGVRTHGNLIVRPVWYVDDRSKGPGTVFGDISRYIGPVRSAVYALKDRCIANGIYGVLVRRVDGYTEYRATGERTRGRR